MRVFAQNWIPRALAALSVTVALTGCDVNLGDFQIHGDSEVNNPTQDSPNHTQLELRNLRFISYNIWGLPAPLTTDNSRFPDINRLIPTLKADVIAFQETFTSDSEGLAYLPGYPFHAYGPLKQGLKLSSGLLTVSRYPIVATAQMLYSKCAGTDCFARKGALYTRIAVDGLGEIDVFNTHMNAAGDDALREYQAKEFFRFIVRHSSGRPLVIMGDFNFNPETVPYYKFTHFLGVRDAHAEYAESHPDLPGWVKDGFTADPRRNVHLKNQNQPPQRIDYIFIRDEDEQLVEVKSTGLVFDAPVNGRHLSDHFGVSGDLTIEVANALQTGHRDLSDLLALELY